MIPMVILIFGLVCAFALYSRNGVDRYAETVECYVSARGSQPATGEAFTLTVDQRKTIRVQASQCVNMEMLAVGDKFTAVLVTDSDNILQCVVRVED